MPRSPGVSAGAARKAARAAAERDGDPVQVLHHLGNNIHSLALRLLVLESAGLPTDLRRHVDAASRLVQQSADLVEHIHQLLDGRSPARPRPRPARRAR